MRLTITPNSMSFRYLARWHESSIFKYASEDKENFDYCIETKRLPLTFCQYYNKVIGLFMFHIFLGIFIASPLYALLFLFINHGNVGETIDSSSGISFLIITIGMSFMVFAIIFLISWPFVKIYSWAKEKHRIRNRIRNRGVLKREDKVSFFSTLIFAIKHKVCPIIDYKNG